MTNQQDNWEIRQEDDGKHGRLFLLVDGQELAEMTYTWAGSTLLIIDHTAVAEALKGQNAGMTLLKKVVEFARQKRVQILPLCPFANQAFQKTPEIRDVLR